METISLKALALKTLEGNQQGNSQETKSFPRDIQEGNLGKSFPVELPRVGNQETLKKKPTKAKGYGCSGCGGRVYTQAEIWATTSLPIDADWEQEHSLVMGWKCYLCGSEYQYIGGSKGVRVN